MFGKLQSEQLESDIVSSSVTNADFSTINTAQIADNGNSGRNSHPIKDIRTNDQIDSNVTSIISALLSAVLALVVLMLVIFIVQAIKRRRRERQGTLLNQPVIHAIAPPVFAPTTAAYASRISGLSSRNITWENVSQSSARVLHPVDRAESQQTTEHRQTNNGLASASSTASSSINMLSSTSSSSCS